VAQIGNGVGLVSKNAILIIEFARNQKQQGQALMQAVALASGAGAASQNAIGIAATFLAIFFVPMFYVGIEKLFDRGAKTARPIGD